MGLALREPFSELEPWRVLRVESRREAQVQSLLEKQGVQAVSPHAKVRRRWTDRDTILDVPLLPGYVFARVRLIDRTAVLQAIPYAHNFLSFGGGDPVTVPDSEVESIMLVAATEGAEGLAHLVVGKPVRITRGCLAGVVGVLAEIKGRYRVAVNVEMLGRAVTTHFDRSMVEMVK